MTSHHKQAQWAEYTKLKEIIGEAYKAHKRTLRIFDIGIGYARIPVLLSAVDTWEKIARYVGIDISPHCVAQSKRIITSKKIADKLEVIRFDAVDLKTDHGEPFQRDKYNLIVCTYFTAGDFKPKQIQLKTDKKGFIADYDINLLKPNEDFVAVFKGAFDLLEDGGKIVLGSVYCDSDLAREVQERLYRKCEMAVITSQKDLFTATKEGFWSERFNKERIYEYLSWVPRDKIELIPLDDYNFAIMIIVNK
jgi:SAM-dependent methyltransferase